MKFIFPFTGKLKARLYPNIRRQEGIERECEFIRGYAAFRVEMRHLRPGMHSAVGSPRSMERQAFARELCERFCCRFLYGNTVRLYLPADIIRSVIFNYQYYSSHTQIIMPFALFRKEENRFLHCNRSLYLL